MAIIAFAVPREILGIDWKIPTTASSWRQLEDYLWPEVHKWWPLVRWKKLGAELQGDIVTWPSGRLELLDMDIKGIHGRAFALASNDPAKIEGAHADHLLYVIDESKRLDVLTPIPTPQGWTTMGEVQVGDAILDEQGLPTQVTYVSPIIEGRPCLRVTFSDGSEVVADEGHLWSVLPQRRRWVWGARHTNDARYKRQYDGVSDWREFWDHAHVIETRELRSAVGARSAIPTCLPLELPDAELSIDPYVLGVWLGDGSTAHGAITTMDDEILTRFAERGYPTKQHGPKRSRAGTYGVEGLQVRLRAEGLLANKHIPPSYLRASKQQRLELLRGLMDSDGTVMGTGSRRVKDSRVSFSSTNENLAEGVAELVRTFGWKVHVRKGTARLNGIDMGPVFVLRWSADICPFHLERKAERWVPRGAQASKATIRSVVSVEPTSSVPTRCIAVDSPRHLYLAGRGFIPTHNTVPEETFDAIEGAFAGAGADTSQEAYALAQSTPGITAGRFYEIHQRKEGLTRWTALHTSKDQAIAEGALSAEWAEDRRLHWGERDPRYVRRVLGDFAPDDGTGVIPLSLVEAALERGKFWSRRLEAGEELPSFTCVSADIADVGQDLNVLGIRHDSVLSELRSWEDSASEVGDPTMKASGRIVAALRPRPGGYTVIDGIGVGAGVVGRVREATAEESIDARVVPFIASRGTDRRDATGEFGFPDSRSAAWWNLREMLAGDSEIAFIVADQATEDRLTSDLTAPTWSEVSGGKIRVEPKKDIRKRLGRSTDYADVVVQAFWPPDDRAPAAISSPASVTLPRLSR